MDKKIARIDSELCRRIAEILNTKINDPRIAGGLITVTSVKTTRDLKYAKVYLGILNVPDVDEAVKAINNAQGFIRNELKTAVDIRNIPDLTFFHDKNIEYGIKIDKILKELEKNDTGREA